MQTLLLERVVYRLFLSGLCPVHRYFGRTCIMCVVFRLESQSCQHRSEATTNLTRRNQH